MAKRTAAPDWQCHCQISARKVIETSLQGLGQGSRLPDWAVSFHAEGAP